MATASTGSPDTAVVRSRRKRRPHRRDEIIAAATTLFHERGYHATGMDEIGAAAGITGPAIYRHFESKEEILEQIVTDRSSAALEHAREIMEQAPTPLDAFRGLVTVYVDVILENPSLAYVGVFERRTLAGETKTRLERAERQHLEQWVRALIAVRPGLDEAEARVMIQGANGLALMASIYRSRLARPVRSALIIEMIMNALLVDPTSLASSSAGS
ncbi:MAG TPA: helix-turn-helix domain-containing protein [Acidimicrobiales bacterium]